MPNEGDRMKIETVRQFRNRATSLIKQEESVIVTRYGKIVGFYLPAVGEAISLKIKQDLFLTITDEIRATVKGRGLTEGAILDDFEKTRKARHRR